MGERDRFAVESTSSMADDWNSTVLISKLINYSNLLANQDDPIQTYSISSSSVFYFNPENISFTSGGGYWGVKPAGEIGVFTD